MSIFFLIYRNHSVFEDHPHSLSGLIVSLDLTWKYKDNEAKKDKKRKKVNLRVMVPTSHLHFWFLGRGFKDVLDCMQQRVNGFFLEFLKWAQISS